ncbi:MAG: homoserine kinase [Flavobacteriales bacterium]
MKERVEVWAPATVANMNVGFDALGCALTAPGERMILHRTLHTGDVHIRAIHGAQLDANPERNVATIAAKSLLQSLGNPCGLEVEIFKSIMPGSGIGSSAASAAAAVVGVNELLDAGLRPDELIPYALDGESFASGARHADNVAPALMGGLVICPPEGPPVAIPAPQQWSLVVLHPQVPIKTADARAVLPGQVSLKDAAAQAAWFGAFVAACHGGDGTAAAYALEDLLVGPHRSMLIPHFNEVRTLAFDHGARAGGISGSGPSTFWVALDTAAADAIKQALSELMQRHSIPFSVHISAISGRGAHCIS